MKRKWGYILAAVLVVVALVVILVVSLNGNKGYVATVAGEKITKAEYNFFLSNVKSQMESVAQVTDENRESFWQSTIDGKNAEEQAKANALDNAKEFKIQLIKAREKGVTLTEDTEKGIETEIETAIDQYGKAEVEKQIRDMYNISLSEYRSIYKDYVLAYYVFREKAAKEITVSEEEVKKAYDENTESLKDSVDKVTVRHILFSATSEDTEEKQKEAKEKAEDILAKVQAGEDMEALAKEYSEDPGVASNGGQYIFDYTGRVFTQSGSKLVAAGNYLVAQFPGWAFYQAEKVGDSAVVQTSYGYHVLKLEDRTTYEDVKEDAKYGLQLIKYQEQLNQWKNDPAFNVVPNQDVYSSIKILK